MITQASEWTYSTNSLSTTIKILLYDVMIRSYREHFISMIST